MGVAVALVLWIMGAVTEPLPAGADRGDPQALGDPDQRIQVLILGYDVEVSPSGRRLIGRSDTIMVASFDPLLQKIEVLSIPRDTRTEIPGRGPDKINAAAAYGGASLSLVTVSQFLNYPLENYVLLSVEGFADLVDMIGGIDVYVPYDMNYDDPAQDLSIHIKKGFQHLNGYQAMGFVRERYGDPDGDFGRIRRQQAFLKALAEKMVQPSNWTKAPQLIQEALKYVRTNLSLDDILSLANIGRKAGPEGLVTDTLPTQDLSLKGIAYQKADPDTVALYVNRYVRGIDPAENSQVRVRILYPEGQDKLAAAAGDALQALGYQVVDIALAHGEYKRPTAVFAQRNQGVAGRVLVRTLRYVWEDLSAPYDASYLDRPDQELAGSDGRPVEWDAALWVGPELTTEKVAEILTLQPAEKNP
ncbi:MAG: LCP family protein [Bacillota bacterium]|nr:LCP family protein [Bacillota bacterium]